MISTTLPICKYRQQFSSGCTACNRNKYLCSHPEMVKRLGGRNKNNVIVTRSHCISCSLYQDDTKSETVVDRNCDQAIRSLIETSRRLLESVIASMDPPSGNPLNNVISLMEVENWESARKIVSANIPNKQGLVLDRLIACIADIYDKSQDCERHRKAGITNDERMPNGL